METSFASIMVLAMKKKELVGALLYILELTVKILLLVRL